MRSVILPVLFVDEFVRNAECGVSLAQFVGCKLRTDISAVKL